MLDFLSSFIFQDISQLHLYLENDLARYPINEYVFFLLRTLWILHHCLLILNVAWIMLSPIGTSLNPPPTLNHTLHKPIYDFLFWPRCPPDFSLFKYLYFDDYSGDYSVCLWLVEVWYYLELLSSSWTMLKILTPFNLLSIYKQLLCILVDFTF